MPEVKATKKLPEINREAKLVFSMVEVIEHIPKERHPILIENITRLQPDLIIITTPNIQFNKFFNMVQGELRDKDHKFEFNPEEFEKFVESMSTNQYDCVIRGLQYPNPSRITGQYKHKLEDFKSVPATLMAILTLKKRSVERYEFDGFVELPLIQKPQATHKFKELISVDKP